MITHAYRATYTIQSIGRKFFRGILHRVPGKKVIVDRIMINKTSKDFEIGKTYVIGGYHHDEPSEYGHKVIIEPMKVVSV